MLIIDKSSKLKKTSTQPTPTSSMSPWLQEFDSIIISTYQQLWCKDNDDAKMLMQTIINHHINLNNCDDDADAAN